jgi:hypothetical protein
MDFTSNFDYYWKFYKKQRPKKEILLLFEELL